ncbi:MAG: anthranilate synthase component II [Phycisphaerales bacterium]
MPRVLMIDNYDSFTFNLVQYLCELGAEVVVKRNDAITPAAALAGGFTHLVVSPGPGSPREAGISMAIIKACAPVMPVLGVCLGHQAMAEVFGGSVTRAPVLMHGKPSAITHDGKGVFVGLPARIDVGRYHSLCVQTHDVPPHFIITSRAINADGSEGEVMGIRHTSLPCEGVQFHPESVLTPTGKQMIANFLAFTPSQREGAGGGQVSGGAVAAASALPHS